jgi:hypothetical protein
MVQIEVQVCVSSRHHKLSPKNDANLINHKEVGN